MAQKGIKLDQKTLSCSICLDLLKDPVAIPCGHSYCMSCIKNHWDGEDMKNIHSCPQCRQTFKHRPVLVKNTMMADLVEQLKKTGCGLAAADRCYAGAKDVTCDVCTRRKQKAVKSCLQCLVSYCHKHLQPHHKSAAFKKHKLVDPLEIQENICSHHGEVMKMFCRSDHQCICYLCSVDEHKGHNIVSAAAERTERQTELDVSRQKLQQRIKDKQKDVKLLQQEAEDISRSADEAVKKSHKILTDLIQLLEKRKHDMERQIRSQQDTEMSRVRQLESKLEQEITELRRKDAKMDKLSRTYLHSQFLLQYPSVSQFSEDPDSSHFHIRPQGYFEDVMTSVSEFRDKLQPILTEGWTPQPNIGFWSGLGIQLSRILTLPLSKQQPEPQALQQPEPQTRAGFMRYSRKITLDPNTVNEDLSLSEENKRVTASQTQNFPHHPDRFSVWWQVLSRESLTGRCYWEVEWSGWGVQVAVAYKDIKREGSSTECLFGFNDKSWALDCYSNSPVFRHNAVESRVPGPIPSRIGVYLDHTAGILSFYSISETRTQFYRVHTTFTLIHRVQTTFTQPLYAGVRLWWGDGTTAHFPKLQ